jgi:hypothetical protein
VGHLDDCAQGLGCAARGCEGLSLRGVNQAAGWAPSSPPLQGE